MLGSLYLCFEGFEKVLHMVGGVPHVAPAVAHRYADATALEEQKVSGAIRTDFVLSAEIMAIALASITASNSAHSNPGLGSRCRVDHRRRLRCGGADCQSR